MKNGKKKKSTHFLESLKSLIFIRRWFDDDATIRDYFKYFFKREGIKIGFCSEISNTSFLNPFRYAYNELDASTRFRVNDVIYQSLYSNELNIRFYNPFRKLDILVFQKNFSEKAYKIACSTKLRKKIKIVLDLNVNYFDKKTGYITQEQREDVIRFTKITDKIITTTQYLKDYLINNDLFTDIEVIPEMIPDRFFTIKKKHTNKKKINLLYVGYTIKARELELIKDALEQLNKKYNLNLITICERPPKLNIKIKKQFIKYHPFTVHNTMLKGDIFITSRDMNWSYNLGHSFLKIGHPLAIGIPVVASPIPSYLKSPAIICNDKASWFNNIKELIEDSDLRSSLGRDSIKYCKANFSSNIIMKKYRRFFKDILFRS